MTKRPLYLKVSICLLILATNAAALGTSPGKQTEVPPYRASQSGLQVPAALRPALYRALAADAGPAYRPGKDGCAVLLKPSLQACFDQHGVHFSRKGARPLALHLVAYGRDSELAPVGSARPVIKGDRVTYHHGRLNEWWRVLPTGFEQGFTITRRPDGHGRLTLALAASRNPGMNNGVLAWGKLRYGKLVATDARGKIIPATLESKGNGILIALDDARAAYPLTVDPLVWIQQKVTASDGTANDEFGSSVAISGTSAFIATPNKSQTGAVYVFSESNGAWTQTQKLTGNYGDFFGFSVALDGTTALIGAPYAAVSGNGAQGKVYVYSKSGSSWNETQVLTATEGVSNDNFGSSVSLSGTTALIGAPAFSGDVTPPGSAYVFSESNGNWSEVQRLTASDGADGDNFGLSVALSGTTVFVGAPYAGDGAAYVFTGSNGTWTQDQKLVADDGATADNFGYSIGLSGTTALVGAPLADRAQGTVYVFSGSGGSWIQAEKLKSNDPSGLSFAFGNSVALNNATALIGADEATVNGNTDQGAAYLFVQSSGTWTKEQKLVATDGAKNDSFGTSVALDNAAALVSAPAATVMNNQWQGAAYFYRGSDLDIASSAPSHTGSGTTYIYRTIVTNNASSASPAAAVTAAIPAGASFISANATQGDCNESSGVVTCDFGTISGNAGMATANITLKATGNTGSQIDNTASVADTVPRLASSVSTTIGNNPPVANNGSLTVNANSIGHGTLKATDPDGDALTFIIETPPGHGSVTITDPNTGAYTYTPSPGYSGNDSFTFKANDGEADSNIATINVTVKPPGSGGGGGSTGWWTLLALLGLAILGAAPGIRRG